jgi:hypothetical protein
MVSLVFVRLSTARPRHDSNMRPISLVCLSIVTGAPMLVGRTVGLLHRHSVDSARRRRPAGITCGRRRG